MQIGHHRCQWWPFARVGHRFPQSRATRNPPSCAIRSSSRSSRSLFPVPRRESRSLSRSCSALPSPMGWLRRPPVAWSRGPSTKAVPATSGSLGRPTTRRAGSLPIAATMARRSPTSRSRRTAARSRTCAAEARMGTARFRIPRSTSQAKRRRCGWYSCRAVRHGGSVTDTPPPFRRLAVASRSKKADRSGKHRSATRWRPRS